MSPQYTAIESQGSYLTQGSGQPMKLPLAAPKPLISLSKALYWCVQVPYLLHVGSIIPMIVDVERGSDRTTPVIELKCEAYLRLVSDPATVERGWMVHSLRTTGSGALNFCLVAQVPSTFPGEFCI